MNDRIRNGVLCAAWVWVSGFGPGTVPAQGQGFDSRSNGSFGPLEITENTVLELPPDGVIHATTVSIPLNRDLRFVPNALNTPVYLLATGDVRIEGRIFVDGSSVSNLGGSLTGVGAAGGPGGFPGGNAGLEAEGVPPGDGHGPGGGRAGRDDASSGGAGGGGYGRPGRPQDPQNPNGGPVYGNPLIFPLIGGSGGGGAIRAVGSGADGAGGGGGGAILVASNTEVAFGSSGRISANGGTTGNNARNGGSGGAIRVVAPRVTGTPTFQVGGGPGAGSGRVRIDALDLSEARPSVSSDASFTVGAVLFVDPAPPYRVELAEVAGTPVPDGAAAPVFIILPQGSDPEQTVTVRAEGLSGVVPVEVVLTPDNGPRSVYPVDLDLTGGGPVEAVVGVTFPVNIRTRVRVWTR